MNKRHDIQSLTAHLAVVVVGVVVRGEDVNVVALEIQLTHAKS